MKINLGSGMNYLKGYVNVDPQAKKKVDVAMFAQDYLAERDHNSADEILVEHLLEHLSPGVADSLLEECHRVLKPEGVIIVECPDLRKVLRSYGDGDIALHAVRKALYGSLTGIEVGEGHVWAYTEKEMAERLKRIGFDSILCFVCPGEFRWNSTLSFRIRALKCST